MTKNFNSVLNVCAMLAFIVPAYAQAQDVDSSLAYYPMHKGDRWEYQGYMISADPYYSLTITIVADTVANGDRYFVFEEKHSANGTKRYWKRLDSLSGSVYVRMPDQSNEIQEDSLRAKPGDLFRWHSYTKKCFLQYTDTVLGSITPIKIFGDIIGSPVYSLAYSIGLIYWSLDDGMSVGLEERKLKYAVINGKEFGMPLYVRTRSSHPEGYSLQQNYPNPFNPATTIEYSIPRTSDVSIAITNVLGQRIAEWNYRMKEAGRYSVAWSPVTPSGIYFYTLKTRSVSKPSEQFVETKKMVYMK